MTAVSRDPVTAFLLRAGIVAGVLAIIAGIFGMHVMTGNHTMHSPAAAQTPAAAMTAADGHTGHTGHQSAAHNEVPGTTTTAAWPRAADVLGAGPAASCTCSAECHSVPAMSAACVPSAKTGTLTAPDPGQGTLAFNNIAVRYDGLSISYSYLPGGPSPGELSISRT